jgi:hypothetical protein
VALSGKIIMKSVWLQVTTRRSNRCKFWCHAIRHARCSQLCGVTGLLSGWCERQWKIPGTRMRKLDSLRSVSRSGSRNCPLCGTASEVPYSTWHPLSSYPMPHFNTQSDTVLVLLSSLSFISDELRTLRLCVQEVKCDSWWACVDSRMLLVASRKFVGCSNRPHCVSVQNKEWAESVHYCRPSCLSANSFVDDCFSIDR